MGFGTFETPLGSLEKSVILGKKGAFLGPYEKRQKKNLNPGFSEISQKQQNIRQKTGIAFWEVLRFLRKLS